jgi:alanine racemase
MRNNYAEISVSNLNHNIDEMRKNLRPETKFLAVVKANAYGHGMEIVANTALYHGADYLAVAIAEEGARLRSAGIVAPVLLLGATDDAHLDSVIDYDLIPTIISVPMLLEFQRRAAARNRKCPFHFKIDTGMNRIGFKEEEAFERALSLLPQCPNLIFEGMFTHFAVSEIPDKTFTYEQLKRFQTFIAMANRHGYHPLLHAANSGATLDLPKETQFDMVRGGLAMYGCHPAGQQVPEYNLRPVLSWKTVTLHVKDVAPGEGVSYGLTFVADHPMRVATLPVGYGDGYKRCMSNRAQVLIRGKRAPQIGTICMDQMMVDVTHIPGAMVGDEAVLIGTQEEETITADEMAAWADTISYEILLSISDRVPRVAVK